jgi:hypothetical protein
MQFLSKFTRSRLLMWAILGLSVASCAAELVRSPSSLKVAGPPNEVIELIQPSRINLGPGNETILFTGSRWRFLGVIEQGRVYKPLETSFSIQAANSHEAYLVIKENRIIGFYLPGERAWSALVERTDIRFKPVML